MPSCFQAVVITTFLSAKLLLITLARYFIFESFYGSPANFSSTKSLILKPAPGRISRHTAPLATPTSWFDSPFFHNKRKYMQIYFSSRPSSYRAAIKCLLKKIAGFVEGYRRISLSFRKNSTGFGVCLFLLGLHSRFWAQMTRN